MAEWKVPLWAQGATGKTAASESGQALEAALVTAVPQGFVCVLSPAAGVDRALPELASRCSGEILTLLDTHGAVLFRGFRPSDAMQLELLCRWLGDGAGHARQETSPRTRVGRGVYTVTDYPAEFPIGFHNESSYEPAVPGKVLFHCVRPAPQGGETWLSDCQAVWRQLPAALKASFSDGYRLVRSYHPHYGLPWQRAFGGTRADLETYAAGNGIELHWRAGGVLTTVQTCRSEAVHPRTGEPLWLNHIHFFNRCALPDAARALLEQGRTAMENDTLHADGAPVDASALAAIGAAYEANALRFALRPGDVLLLDNLRIAHGRAAYHGTREIYFAHTERLRWDRLAGRPFAGAPLRAPAFCERSRA